jgi:hypothetical protein
MHPRTICLSAVVLAALAGAAPGSTLLERMAGGRIENLVVRKFLVGTLEANTDRFVARSGRDEQAVLRDEVLLIEFSSPVDMATVDLRTVRIGIPTTPGLMIQARGAIYPCIEKKFDPVSGGFVFSRRRRNRILFDPTARQEPEESRKNPCGWEANSPYTVTVHGTDSGSLNTVATPDGSPLIRTFRTTFRTTDAYGDRYR